MAFTHTTGTSAAAWRPDLFTFAPETVLAPALIFSATTVSGRIEGDAPSLRVAYADDVDASFYDEGQTFDEAEPDLAEALVYTKKFGELVRITREQYRQAGTDQHLAQSVARSMIRKADNALLAQPAPVGPAVAPSTGLTNTAGLVTGLLDGDLDVLIDLEASVRANRGIPAAWVLAPDMWASLRRLKVLSSGSNQSLLGAGTEDADPRLLTIPIVVNPEMPSGSGLLVDPTAIVSAVSDLTLETDPSIYHVAVHRDYGKHADRAHRGQARPRRPVRHPQAVDRHPRFALGGHVRPEVRRVDDSHHHLQRANGRSGQDRARQPARRLGRIGMDRHRIQRRPLHRHVTRRHSHRRRNRVDRRHLQRDRRLAVACQAWLLLG